MPTSINVAIFFAILLTAVVPILLLLILLLRKKVNLMPLLLGLLTFFVSGILLRDGVLFALSNRWPVLITVFPAWLLFAALVSALFAESGRVLARKQFPAYGAYNDALSFGLGFGLSEVVLTVGLALYVNALVAMSAAGYNSLSATDIGLAELEEMYAQLHAIGPVFYFYKIIESVGLTLFHVFASLLIFAGFNRGQIGKYWLLALAAHLLFCYVRFMLAQYANIWLALLAMFGLAVLLGGLLRESRQGFPEPGGQEHAE